MELVQIHRILQFSQSAWIKPYIDFNTTKLKNIVNISANLVQTFYKQRVWQNQGVPSKQAQLETSNEPNKSQEIVCTTYLSAIRYYQQRFDINHYDERQFSAQPTDISCFSTLDLSKIRIYRFHYQQIVAKYGSKAKLGIHRYWQFRLPDRNEKHIATIWRPSLMLLRLATHPFDSKWKQQHWGSLRMSVILSHTNLSDFETRYIRWSFQTVVTRLQQRVFQDRTY